MIKKVLVFYYSQTGQLEQIADSFIAPMIAAGVSIEKVSITPEKQYGFPWTAKRFFEEMPSSVLGIPAPLLPFHFKESKYDLVIFGWQPWFLSPSIPTTSLLLHPSVKAVIKDTPVVMLTGARNMWLNAMEKIKPLLRQAGAKLVGNVVLMDQHQNFISGITILYWMFSGKKDNFLSVFPKPGVSDKDIAGAGMFGETVLKHLQSGDFSDLQASLVEQKALHVKWDLMFIEARAGKLFSIWAKLIAKKKNRDPWLVLFKYYLLIALFIVAPVVVGTYGLLFKPFLTKSINKKKQHYLELN
jgi:hypothetical protein